MERTRANAPGRSDRNGLDLIQLLEMFPDERAAVQWFETQMWAESGRCCGHCGSVRTGPASHARMPYWCSDCRSYFSVRTGTALERSHVPLRKWAVAIYLEITSLKSVSSMKLHRDLGVSQPTAWYMLHRIREGWKQSDGPYGGPVESDETYVGGRQRNMRASRRKQLPGGGASHMTAVAGVRDRATNRVSAEVVRSTDGGTLQGFVTGRTQEGSTVYTDHASAYRGLPRLHETVRHSVAEYVRGQAHTNGIESFWAVLKRAHKGVFHKISPKHLNRYVTEFAGKHNVRDLDTLAQMTALVAGLAGKRLLRRELVADNGLPSGARS